MCSFSSTGGTLFVVYRYTSTCSVRKEGGSTWYCTVVVSVVYSSRRRDVRRVIAYSLHPKARQVFFIVTANIYQMDAVY